MSSKSPQQPIVHLLQNHFFLVFIIGIELVLFALVPRGVAHTDWWQTTQLGIVEGVTEFLPVSSTAHLLIVSKLMHFRHSIGGTFEIFIQLGAIVAVVGYYARDILSQAQHITTNRQTQRFWLGIIIAFLPAVLIGLTLHSWIKAVLFDSPSTIAWALIIGGIVFIVVETMPPRRATVHAPQDISLWQSFAIGIAQTVAMIPGISRSGASIVGGMLAGLDRQTATSFSFYLAMPTLGAATLYDLLKNLDHIATNELGWLLLGALISMVVAWLSIGWLLRFVSTNSFLPFGIYRILAGGAILLLVQKGLL